VGVLVGGPAVGVAVSVDVGVSGGIVGVAVSVGLGTMVGVAVKVGMSVLVGVGVAWGARPVSPLTVHPRLIAMAAATINRIHRFLVIRILPLIFGVYYRPLVVHYANPGGGQEAESGALVGVAVPVGRSVGTARPQ
jgi:hypothetical protein